MSTHPRAGTPAQPGDLVDVAALLAAYTDRHPDPHEKGQRVLIGTASVAKSEILSRQLKQAGVKHVVLNAKQHER